MKWNEIIQTNIYTRAFVFHTQDAIVITAGTFFDEIDKRVRVHCLLRPLTIQLIEQWKVKQLIERWSTKKLLEVYKSQIR